VLINLERVGGLGSRPDDVLLLGDCDEGVRRFADALGWREELEELWAKTNPDKAEREKQVKPKDKQTQLDEAIEALTKGVDQTLKLSDAHQKQFQDEFAKRPDTGELKVPSAEQPASAESKVKQQSEIHDSRSASLEHVYPHMSNEKSEKPSL